MVVGFGDGSVRIEVVDQGGERVPHLCDVTSQEEGGRGLLLIAACAKDWGVKNFARRAFRLGGTGLGGRVAGCRSLMGCHCRVGGDG
ncbi:hypothetical protein SALBM217S_06281 [Streptomyces griseoloalbus]